MVGVTVSRPWKTEEYVGGGRVGTGVRRRSSGPSKDGFKEETEGTAGGVVEQVWDPMSFLLRE